MNTNSWSQAMSLVLRQWTSATIVVAATLLVTGSISVWLPAFAVFATAAMHRPPVTMHALSRRAAVAHGLLAFVSLGVLAAVRPDWFAGAVIPLTVLAGATFASLAGFGLTLCGLSLDLRAGSQHG